MLKTSSMTLFVQSTVNQMLTLVEQCSYFVIVKNEPLIVIKELLIQVDNNHFSRNVEFLLLHKNNDKLYKCKHPWQKVCNPIHPNHNFT